ncbi:polysaccharide deacetylase family protein [bacterium]|nr:polysaccharide deacetylase family protein [bacterium]
MNERGGQLPVGFVHVDLDGLWTLAGCYGYPEGDSFADDPTFNLALPRLLGLFDEFDIKATFFISGRDLELPEKADAVRRIAAAGHELACHGYSHRMDLEDLSDADIDDELARAADAIARAGGSRPIGYRAAGYAAGPRMLAAVARARMKYDGSLLPTYWAPLLRLMAGRLRSRVERETGGKAPRAPGQYGRGGRLSPQWFDPGRGLGKVLRLPVAVSPTLRLPIHASIGMLIGADFVRGGLRGLARRGVPICYLLHGMDAIGAEELTGRLPNALMSTKAFRVGLQKKMGFLRSVMGELKVVARVQRSDGWVEKQVDWGWTG